MRITTILISLVIISFFLWTIVAQRDDETQQTNNNFEKGINVALFRKIEKVELPKLEETLDRLKKKGVTHISLVFYIFQEDKWTTEIYQDPHLTPSEDQLISYIRLVKKKGFSLQLRPLLGLKKYANNSEGRWNITPKNINLWFSSYERQILKYAALAAEEKVQVFGIGSEMSSLSGKTSQWKDLVRNVKNVYKGKILYAANWDEVVSGSFATNIDWLTQVDIIGIDAYFPLEVEKNADASDLLNAWEKWAHVFTRFQQVDKQIIVSEVGISSITDHFNSPWEFDFEEGDIDLLAQEKYYEATFRFLMPKVSGIYWWVVNDGLAPEKPREDKSFSPLGKPAEEVLKKWYTSLI